MAKRDTSQLKWKKKKWFEVVAPAEFGNVSLGQALAEDGDHLKGRVIQANMMNVVKSAKMQSVTMRFRIMDTKDSRSVTEAISYVMAPSAIKRLVRPRKDRIDDSFVVETKDGKLVRVKPLLITQFAASSSQQTAIRMHVRNVIAHECAEKEYNTFIKDVVEFNLQRTMKKAASRVLPLKTVDIRAFELVEEKVEQVVKPVAEEPVAEEEVFEEEAPAEEAKPAAE